MNALYILIGISLFVAIGFLCAFLWAVRGGQYEDDYTPAVRILFENPPTPEKIPKQSFDKEDTLCKTYTAINIPTTKNKK
jgi:cbb3-type cytochrome oxidase maturation protein